MEIKSLLFHFQNYMYMYKTLNIFIDTNLNNCKIECQFTTNKLVFKGFIFLCLLLNFLCHVTSGSKVPTPLSHWVRLAVDGLRVRLPFGIPIHRAHSSSSDGQLQQQLWATANHVYAKITRSSVHNYLWGYKTVFSVPKAENRKR